jgi:hypothetical protein
MKLSDVINYNCYLAEVFDACLMLVLSQVEMRHETRLKMRCEIRLMPQGAPYVTNIPLA